MVAAAEHIGQFAAAIANREPFALVNLLPQSIF